MNTSLYITKEPKIDFSIREDKKVMLIISKIKDNEENRYLRMKLDSLDKKS